MTDDGTQEAPAHRRRLSIEGVSPRRRRHIVAGALIAAYVLVAVGVVAAHDAVAVPQWLALHVLALGAASTAVFVYSRHFAQALLHTRPGAQWPAHVRLAALNAGAVTVLAGMVADLPWLSVTGAVVVGAAVIAHTVDLVLMSRGAILAGRLRVVVWFYVAGGVALVAGAALGASMAVGSIRSARWQEAVYLAHAHLSLLGWLGLVVVGTLFMLWPAVLRTRLVDSAADFARRALVITVTGLTVAVGGELLGAVFGAAHWIAALGMAGYAAGVVCALRPALEEARVKHPRTPAPVWLVAGGSWLLAALVVDIAGLVRGDGVAGDLLARFLVPMLGVGVIAQILAGALTFIVPVTVGGGPLGNRRMAAILELAWLPRLVAVNLGVLLLVVPAVGVSHAVGWTLVVAGIGSFPPLVAAALIVGRRPLVLPPLPPSPLPTVPPASPPAAPARSAPLLTLAPPSAAPEPSPVAAPSGGAASVPASPEPPASPSLPLLSGGTTSATAGGTATVAVGERPHRVPRELPQGRTGLAVGSVLAVLGVLALIGVGTGAWPGSASGAAGTSTATVASGAPVPVTLEEFEIAPRTITVAAGTHLVVIVHNSGRLSHDLLLDGQHGTRVLAPGARQIVDLGVITHNQLAWCTVPGHRSAGMVLDIHVASPAASR